MAELAHDDTPSGSTALREQVAEEVRVWLARRKMSGAGLARALGRSQTFVQKRLDGRQAFDVDDLEAVARVLQVPVSVFFAPRADSIRNSPRNRRSVTESAQVIGLDSRRAAATVTRQCAGRGGEHETAA